MRCLTRPAACAGNAPKGFNRHWVIVFRHIAEPVSLVLHDRTKNPLNLTGKEIQPLFDMERQGHV